MTIFDNASVGVRRRPASRLLCASAACGVATFVAKGVSLAVFHDVARRQEARGVIVRRRAPRGVEEIVAAEVSSSNGDSGRFVA